MIKTHRRVSLAFAISLLMIFTGTPAIAGDGFARDEPSRWAVEHIMRASELELIPAHLFGRYKQPVSRAEFSALAVLVFEEVTGMAIEERAEYDDTDDLSVSKLGGLGVIQGTGDKLFQPNSYLKRQEAAVLLSRLSHSLGRALRANWPTFSDTQEIPNWAVREVGQIQAYGFMEGIGENLFAPEGYITIEQSIKIFLSLYDFANTPEPEKISVNDSAARNIRIPILMYHAFSETEPAYNASLYVKPDALESQLKYLAENGYQAITFEDLDNIGAFSRPIMLTFDDAYKEHYTVLLPLLKKYNLKATVFVITSLLGANGYITAEEATEMSDTGIVSIQSHTVSHRLLPGLSDEELRRELSESKVYLEELTGKPVNVLCYPVGKNSAPVRTVVGEYYDYAVLMEGWQFTCGKSTLAMDRIFIGRSYTIDTFASVVG